MTPTRSDLDDRIELRALVDEYAWAVEGITPQGAGSVLALASAADCLP